MKADNPDEAIDEFLGLPGLETEKGDWSALVLHLPISCHLLTMLGVRGFKGLKQAVKLEYKLGKYDRVCFKQDFH